MAHRWEICINNYEIEPAHVGISHRGDDTVCVGITLLVE